MIRSLQLVLNQNPCTVREVFTKDVSTKWPHLFFLGFNLQLQTQRIARAA